MFMFAPNYRLAALALSRLHNVKTLYFASGLQRSHISAANIK
jgi:hypothetical protein